MDNNSYPERITYNYHTEPDARLRPAHGVWGGINPHGEIEMCFYDESDIPPQFTEQSISSNGSPGPERLLQEDNSRQIKRNIHTRLLLNYHTARAVMDWLQDRVDELESEGGSEMYDLGGGLAQ